MKYGHPRDLRHNLIRIIDATGRMIVSNDYGKRLDRASFDAVIFQRNGRTYDIRTTNPTSLGLVLKTPAGATCSGPPSATCLGLGDFRGKANLLDITNPNSPTTVSTSTPSKSFTTLASIAAKYGKGTTPPCRRRSR